MFVLLTALSAFYFAPQEPCNANSTPHTQLSKPAEETGGVLEHAAVLSAVTFLCFRLKQSINPYVFLYYIVPVEPLRCKINLSKLGSCGESKLRVIICCTQAQHSWPMICSGPGSALLQLSAVYLKGLLWLVLRCFSSRLYAISPTKWLLFINQDLGEVVIGREREALLGWKQRGDRNVTGSWCYHT